MLRNPRPLLVGLLTALVCLLFVFGALTLSLAEGARLLVLPSSTLPPAATLAIASPSTPMPAAPSPLPSPTIPPSPPSCPSPAGWIPLVIQTGQTLEALARAYNISPEALMQANCLLTPTLIPGTVLYVPPGFTATSLACSGAPAGWIPYVVQPGDTLYSLAKYYGVSVAQLQQANCLDGSTLIRAGQTIYVPNMPTRTPYVTITVTSPSPWSSPTETATPSPTETPSPTAACCDTPPVDTPTP